MIITVWRAALQECIQTPFIVLTVLTLVILVLMLPIANLAQLDTSTMGNAWRLRIVRLEPMLTILSLNAKHVQLAVQSV